MAYRAGAHLDYFFPCCCGETHIVANDEDHGTFGLRLAELPPVIAVHTNAGSWRVPRVYIAFHGLTAKDAPSLASIYSWPPASASERGHSWQR